MLPFPVSENLVRTQSLFCSLLHAFPFNLVIHDSAHALISAWFMNHGVSKRPCISLIPQSFEHVKLVTKREGEGAWASLSGLGWTV